MAGTQWSVTNVTSTTFTVTLSTHVTPYQWVLATWYAIGNQ
jgi:hypothetical protein